MAEKGSETCSTSCSSPEMFTDSSDRVYPSVDILHLREIVSYTIPSFTVITVQLRHVVMALCDDEDTVKHYDAFVNVSPNADCVIPEPPATITVTESCNVNVSS